MESKSSPNVLVITLIAFAAGLAVGIFFGDAIANAIDGEPDNILGLEDGKVNVPVSAGIDTLVIHDSKNWRPGVSVTLVVERRETPLYLVSQGPFGFCDFVPTNAPQVTAPMPTYDKRLFEQSVPQSGCRVTGPGTYSLVLNSANHWEVNVAP